VCVCVCVHVCIYVCMYVCVCVCVSIKVTLVVEIFGTSTDVFIIPKNIQTEKTGFEVKKNETGNAKHNS